MIVTMFMRRRENGREVLSGSGAMKTPWFRDAGARLTIAVMAGRAYDDVDTYHKDSS
jgi:hypothetical protein